MELELTITWFLLFKIFLKLGSGFMLEAAQRQALFGTIYRQVLFANVHIALDKNNDLPQNPKWARACFTCKWENIPESEGVICTM